jgi:hypothetical protein
VTGVVPVLAKNGREHVRVNSGGSFVAHLVTSMCCDL